MPRTIIISDTHMPRHERIGSPEALRTLVESCDRFIVNGDLAELHQPGLEEASRKVVDELRANAERASTELLLLSGNHDPLISPWRAAAFGSGRILVTHGDAFHSTIAPWAREAKLIRREWKRIRDSHGRISETIEDRFDAVQGGALAELASERDRKSYSTIFNMLLRPGAIIRILIYWKVAPELARSFAEAFFPDAQFLVVGHTHRCGIDRAANPVIINTGAFAFPSRPLAVVLDGNRLEVVPLVQQGNQWKPESDRPLLVEEVPQADQLAGLWGPHEEASRDRGATESSEQIDRAESSNDSSDTPLSRPSPSQR